LPTVLHTSPLYRVRCSRMFTYFDENPAKIVGTCSAETGSKNSKSVPTHVLTKFSSSRKPRAVFWTRTRYPSTAAAYFRWPFFSHFVHGRIAWAPNRVAVTPLGISVQRRFINFQFSTTVIEANNIVKRTAAGGSTNISSTALLP